MTNDLLHQPAQPAVTRLRCDAARNLERILAAAQDLVADNGFGFTVESVAERAGVGIGTVYRRFPTKEALIEAVVRPVFEQGLAIAEEAASYEPAEDGLERYLRGVTEFHASHRFPIRQLWTAPGGRSLRVHVQPIVAGLLQAAQDGDRVRPDLDYQDLVVSIWTVTGLIDSTAEVAPTLWRRHLDLVIEGMRPGRAPLATPVPPRGADWEAVVDAATGASGG
jgi:AcrR family transcriptional regulator